MTRFWLSAWTLTTLLCAAQIPPGRRSEEQVRAANQQEVQAFLSNDANAMARLLVGQHGDHKSIEQVCHQITGSRDGEVRISDHHVLRSPHRVLPRLRRHGGSSGQRDGNVGRQDAAMPGGPNDYDSRPYG